MERFFCPRRGFAGRAIEDVPRLILLDLELPKVDGLKVLERLKADARTRTVPIVLFTSSREPHDVVLGYNFGVNSFIIKPVTFALFREAVQTVGRYWLTSNLPPTVQR